MRNLGATSVAIVCRVKRDETALPPRIRGMGGRIDDLTGIGWTTNWFQVSLVVRSGMMMRKNVVPIRAFLYEEVITG